MKHNRWVTVCRPVIAGTLLLLGIPSPLTATHAADWPAYRGPAGDGKSPESIAPWPASGPKQLWKTPTPGGFSSFAVGRDRAFTVVRRELEGVPREVCIALDLATGEELWASPVGIAKYDRGGDSGAEGNKGGDGPRSTPALDGKRVYVYNAQLVLHCLDAATGQSFWSRDLLRDHAGRNISWQNATSPLLEGDLVVVSGGGPNQSFLAFHKETGALVWRSGDAKITHATPVAATLQGIRQILFFTQAGLISIRASDGQQLWKHSFPFKTSTAASPVVAGDLVYCTAGYGVGAAVVRVSRTGDQLSATELWKHGGNHPVANHWSTPVHLDGYLYGMFSFKEYGSGPFKCLQVATGKVMWEKPGFGAGNAILAGNRLLALTDAGELVLLDASPEAYRELSRAKVLEGKCWSTPALSNGRAYVRSTEQAACLDLTAGR